MKRAMKARALMFLVTLLAVGLSLLTGCASARPKAAGVKAIGEVVAKASSLDTSAILRLVGSHSVAHACPVAADLALTNAHVTGAEREPYVWATAADGATGLLRYEDSDRFRDIAYVVPAPGQAFPRWYPVAKAAPAPGDRVYFIGFDWRKRKDAFAERPFEARVLRVVAAHVVMETAGVPGTSGSCVLNEAGEVVAINKGGKDTDDGAMVGIAVGVWGDWIDPIARAKAKRAAAEGAVK